MMKNPALAGYAHLAALGEHWQVRSQTAGSLLAERSVRVIRRSGRIYASWLDIWQLEGVSMPYPDDYDCLRKPLLRREKVAARYGISQRSACRWMSNGELPTVRLSPRILRVRERDLDRLDDLQLARDDMA
jgi:predicted DNA-binding transcriptional regulator AlpA